MRYCICIVLMGISLAGCERMPATSAGPSAASSAGETASQAAATNAAVVIPIAVPPPEPAPAAAAVTDEPALQEARKLKAAGNLAGARQLLQSLADQPEPNDAVVDLLGEINTQLAFTPSPAPEKIDYTIAAGDSLGKIAAKHRTTIPLLIRSNNLKSDLIRVGDRLRIYQGDFAVIVSKNQNTLLLTDHGKLFKRYRVGTGEYSKTPVGQFKITSRMEHPTWWRGDKDVPYGDPDNILGTHWLGLDVAGYGLHGTWDNDSIGKQATAGCVRMRNPDIDELYTLLPIGTPVTIRE